MLLRHRGETLCFLLRNYQKLLDFFMEFHCSLWEPIRYMSVSGSLQQGIADAAALQVCRVEWGKAPTAGKTPTPFISKFVRRKTKSE